MFELREDFACFDELVEEVVVALGIREEDLALGDRERETGEEGR